MKKLTITLICVLIAAVIALTAILVAGIQMGGVPFMAAHMGEEKLANRQVFRADEIKTLDLSYRSDTVTVYPAGGNDVVLEEYFSRWDESTVASCVQDGESLRITGGTRRAWFAFRSEIRLYIPSQWDAAVNLNVTSGGIRSDMMMKVAALSAVSKSGSVRLAGVDAGDGAVMLVSKSGSVKADTVRGSEVVLTATSGSIRVGNVKGGTVVATCNSGSIKIEALEGQFALESKSGSVRVGACTGGGTIKCTSGSAKIAFLALEGSLSADCTSGSVGVLLPAGTSLDFYAKTTSGSINTNFKRYLSYSEDQKTATGTVGDEPRHAVRCQTSSGSVRVEIQ